MSKILLNSKSIARIAAIQAIYQINCAGLGNMDVMTSLARIVDFYKDKNLKNDHEINDDIPLKIKPSHSFLKELAKLTHDNINDINGIISGYLNNDRKITSLSKMLLTLLQVAISELKFYPETPKNVIINEYTDIANDMLNSGEVGFVNSVLDRFSSGQK